MAELTFGRQELLAVLPHRPPFLFVDRVIRLEPYRLIVAERVLRPDEPQFAGHFPGRPLMPGVLVAEALAQASGLLLGLSARLDGPQTPARPEMYYLAATNVKFTHLALPGDTLLLRAETDRSFPTLFRFAVEATAGPHVVATGSITLTSKLRGLGNFSPV
jgi:3-hydroxyacyl-[acyl-carrier-protein] dehydratase